MSSAESIVTKRVALAELSILGISETTSLKDKAEDLNPRLFSFTIGISQK
jgi:hypothetical protein